MLKPSVNKNVYSFPAIVPSINYSLPSHKKHSVKHEAKSGVAFTKWPFRTQQIVPYNIYERCFQRNDYIPHTQIKGIIKDETYDSEMR